MGKKSLIIYIIFNFTEKKVQTFAVNFFLHEFFSMSFSICLLEKESAPPWLIKPE